MNLKYCHFTFPPVSGPATIRTQPGVLSDFPLSYLSFASVVVARRSPIDLPPSSLYKRSPNSLRPFRFSALDLPSRRLSLSALHVSPSRHHLFLVFFPFFCRSPLSPLFQQRGRPPLIRFSFARHRAARFFRSSSTLDPLLVFSSFSPRSSSLVLLPFTPVRLQTIQPNGAGFPSAQTSVAPSRRSSVRSIDAPGCICKFSD